MADSIRFYFLKIFFYIQNLWRSPIKSPPNFTMFVVFFSFEIAAPELGAPNF
jgi:hypothetical protein